MVVVTTKNEVTLKADVDETLKRDFDTICGDKNISLKAAVEGLMRLTIAVKDDTARSVMLGQLKPDPELIEFVLEKLRDRDLSPASAHAGAKPVAGAGETKADSGERGNRNKPRTARRGRGSS